MRARRCGRQAAPTHVNRSRSIVSSISITLPSVAFKLIGNSPVLLRDYFDLRGQRVASERENRGLVDFWHPRCVRRAAERNLDHEFRERQAWIIRQRDRHAIRQHDGFADRRVDSAFGHVGGFSLDYRTNNTSLNAATRLHVVRFGTKQKEPRRQAVVAPIWRQASVQCSCRFSKSDNAYNGFSGLRRIPVWSYGALANSSRRAWRSFRSLTQ